MKPMIIDLRSVTASALSSAEPVRLPYSFTPDPLPRFRKQQEPKLKFAVETRKRR